MSGWIVGLTGGIGSGKSTVANLFADYGITVIDADQVARDVVTPPSDALLDIAEHFGDDIIQNDGQLNRRRLRQIVFADPKERQWLDNLLHPLIRARMLDQVAAASSPYAILMVPLLFENGLDKLVQRTVVVDLDPQTQIQRTVKRDDANEQQVQQIIASQMDRQQRCALADNIIHNHGSLADLQKQVAQCHQLFIQLAKKSAKA